PKTLTPQMRRVTPNRVPRRAVHKSGRMVRMTDPSQPPKRLIIGISGASGAIYGVRLLQALKLLPVETHLVMTHTAEVTLAHETKLKVADVRRLADVAYPISDLAASISSGS